MDSGKQTEGFRGEGLGDWDRQVMGIKEDTYCMERWVLNANNESWNTTSITKDKLYGDYRNIIKNYYMKKRNYNETSTMIMPNFAYLY